MAFSYYGYNFIRESDLAHHGVLGMKWGVRRYQNSDGTLTNAGKKRYSQQEKAVNTKYGVTNAAFSKEKYKKSIDDLHGQIESLRIVGKDKDELKRIFNSQRELRRSKRDAHYGTLDDLELLELIQMEIDTDNESLSDIKNRYKSKKVDSVIDQIKKFDTYTDGLFSDYKKGNEYMFKDDILKIYENGLKQNAK